MKLIIGGLAQGKLHYVLQKEGNEKSIIFDGDTGSLEKSRR